VLSKYPNEEHFHFISCSLFLEDNKMFFHSWDKVWLEAQFEGFARSSVS